MLRAIFITIFLVGLGLFLYSLSLPYYNDLAKKDKIEGKSTVNTENFKDEYYAQMAKLRTNKTCFMDLGAGLVIFSTSILLFLLFSKIKLPGDLKNVTSCNKITLFILVNIAWLLLIPGDIWYYTFRQWRQDYPWFADSIGIPLAFSQGMIVMGIIPMNLFILLLSVKSVFPTQIFIKREKYNKTGIISEIFFGIFLLINALCLIGFVFDGDHVSIIVNLVFCYVLLTLRAGHINGYIDGGFNDPDVSPLKTHEPGINNVQSEI